ncbi:DNA ligase 4 isoform X1 [Schistocerca serialis cubense]|uniref:DNA ligase 4 isoform X1 n=2 Tax=Schistocerca serialis cubense TaxID=2023355 RepID=UPI00214EAD6C|nr:DNA ligase 4 isoform X1 [Schistocerca serialis cubense]
MYSTFIFLSGKRIVVVKYCDFIKMVLNIASKIKFCDLCEVCENIQKSPKEKACLILRKYITEYRKLGERLKTEDQQAEISFYPVLRLLIPKFDRERSAYGVKEHALAKIYIRILCLPKGGMDAEKLLNFRSPKAGVNQAGDFAEVAYFVLKNRCGEGKKFTVEDVNSRLDALAQKHAAHDPRGMDDELTLLLTGMSEMEQKWLIRMILKDMKLGVGHIGIFNAFHPDASTLYDVSNDLSKVCTLLHNPDRRLHEVEITIFSPVRPMLSEQCDIQKVENCMKNSAFYYIETKHDGERFQIHFMTGTFKYFSRNGFDYTDIYGSNAMTGVLTPLLSKQLQPGVQSFIIDGEMMVWDKNIVAFRSKGDNIDVKSLKGGSYLQPCYCVFDILFYNGEVLTNKPLCDRIKYLNSLITPCEGVVLQTERNIVKTKDEVIERLNEAIDNKLEGIILKDPESVYKPNSRKAGWFKIKPEYTGGLMDQVDAIIIGGYYGDGRRRGIISHFLLAAAVSKDGAEPEEFHSLVRVGSGYTMAKLEELIQKMKPHWRKCSPGECPPGIIWTKEKPEVWIEPKNSYILQIKATEIVESSSFKVGYTLRFPRVEEIRYDKKWTDCITVSELTDLWQRASGKLYSRHAYSIDPEASSPKKKRTSNHQPQLGKQFCSADVSTATIKSTLLEGKEFCVMSDYNGMTVQHIETQIYENGGKFVKNPGPSTFCVLAAEKNIRVQSHSNSKQYNVIHTEWLLNSVASHKLLPWTPQNIISVTPETEREIMLQYDVFGDSYTEISTEENLKELLSKLESKVSVQKISVHEMADMDIELFSGPSPMGIFRLCIAYFDIPSEDDFEAFCVRKSLELQKLDFEYYGGIVSTMIDDGTTHAVVHSRCQTRLEEIKLLNRDRRKKIHIVNEKWIKDCVDQRRQMDERNY